MINAVILARVSTLKQEKEGHIQLPELRDYAVKRDFEVVKEFIFSESADYKIRKRFNEMIEFVKANDDIKVIISYRVDRITRNYRDAVKIDELRLDYSKEIHFVYDHLVINKDSVGITSGFCRKTSRKARKKRLPKVGSPPNHPIATKRLVKPDTRSMSLMRTPPP